MRKTLATLIFVLAAAGTFTACSGGNPAAEALCTALDQGAVPAAALTQAYHPTNEPAAKAALHQAPIDIRTTCPEHEAAAVAFDNFNTALDQIPPGYSSANGEVNPGGDAG